MEEKKERPQDKWDKKAGYVPKSYKLYKKDIDAFAEACKIANVSQSAQLTKMMREFCKNVNN